MTGVSSAAQMAGVSSAAQSTAVSSAAQTTGVSSAAQTTGVSSASVPANALHKNTHYYINQSIVHSNLTHCITTLSAQVIENNVTQKKSTEDNMTPSTSQGNTNVIVINDEDESQYDNVIITKQQKIPFFVQILSPL